MSDTIPTRVRRIVARLSTVGDREITGDDRLVQDLGLNSMTLIELSVLLESEFDLDVIDGEQAGSLVTVADLENLVTAARAEAKPAV
jgi:acyl carrier protein